MSWLSRLFSRNRHDVSTSAPERMRELMSSMDPGDMAKLRTMIPSMRADDWQNLSLGFGIAGVDKRLGTTFAATGDEIVQRVEAEAMWTANDVAARIITDRPKDMLRKGWRFSAGGDLEDDARDALQMTIANRYRDLRLKAKVRTCLNYERAYGGGALILGIDDGQFPSEPIAWSRVKGIKWINPVIGGIEGDLLSRYTYENVLEDKHGETEIYELFARARGLSRGTTFSPSSIEVHESRVIKFGGIQVSRDQVIANAGWGDSKLTQCKRSLRELGIALGAAGTLLTDFSQTIMKMKNLADMMAGGSSDIVKERMAALQLSRSVMNILLIDVDEDLGRKATPVTGMPDLLEIFMYVIAAAAEEPFTKFWGRSPAGMNATGDGDIEMYNTSLDADREDKLEDPLRYITQLLLAGMGETSEDWSITFPPLRERTETEIAEERKAVAETDKIYFEMGAVPAMTITKSRWGGDGYSTEMVVDFAELERLELEERAIDPRPGQTEIDPNDDGSEDEQ